MCTMSTYCTCDVNSNNVLFSYKDAPSVVSKLNNYMWVRIINIISQFVSDLQSTLYNSYKNSAPLIFLCD